MKLVVVILSLVYLGTCDGYTYINDIDDNLEVELEDEDEKGMDDEEEPDITEDLPEELDLRDKMVIHGAIHQGLTCNSCGWVAGTQALEARIGFVSENYIPYSIQNFMNCAGRVCVGAQPYSVTTAARKYGVIVPESEIPYTQKECLSQGEKKTACFEKCGQLHRESFSNALDDQFVVIAGTGHANTEASLMKALQDGPLTTCFSKKRVEEEGRACSSGCTHANTIIGYTKDNWLLQESYGKHWGQFDDGSWLTTKGSNCGNSINKKAFFPRIFYDYDRANAFYTPEVGGVKEEELQFVEDGVTDADRKNVGTAKNRCAFLGSACKGVVTLSSGASELVSDFGASSGREKRKEKQFAFKKVQMVIYLKHEGSGKYIGLKKTKRGLNLIAVDKDTAAPFFTSYARFISFQYPTFHLVDNNMELIEGGIPDIDPMKSWTLKNCNIYNDVSGNSFDLDHAVKRKIYLGGNKYDALSTSQRFDIGLSGQWELRSTELGLPLAERKKGDKVDVRFMDDSKASIKRFQWNARQIITTKAHPYTADMKISTADFKFENKENAMRPRNCGISRLIPMGWEDYLAMEGGKVVMSSNLDSSWTFEYGDL